MHAVMRNVMGQVKKYFDSGTMPVKAGACKLWCTVYIIQRMNMTATLAESYYMYHKSQKINDQTLFVPVKVLNITQNLFYIQLSMGVQFGLKIFMFCVIISNVQSICLM